MLDELLLNGFKEVLAKSGLGKERVKCETKSGRELSLPSSDYALIRGPEVLIECVVRGVPGHAFSPRPAEFEGDLSELLHSADMSDSRWRGLFFAALNAVMTLTGEIDGGVHCSGRDPEFCGEELARRLLEAGSSSARVLHVGFQPGHVRALSGRFNSLYVTDLSPELVGKSFYGVKVEDGANNLALLEKADVVLITSSAFVNGTIYPILEEALKRGKRVALYGVSGKGACALLRKKVEWLAGVEDYCPFSSLKGSAPRVIRLTPEGHFV